MAMTALLRRIFRYVGFAVLAAIALLIVAISLRIRIDLERFRGPLEALASQSVARQVRLSGDLVLVPTWSLTVEAGGLQIANPSRFGGTNFAKLELVRIRVNVLPLLRRRLEVAEITAENGTLQLVRDSSGQVNWALGGERGSLAPPGIDTDADPAPAREPGWMRLLPTEFTLEKISFRNIVATYRDAVTARDHELVLEEMIGTASTLEPLDLRLRGKLDDHNVNASITGGDPQHLMGGAEPWPMTWSLEFGDARFGIEALIDEHDWGMHDLIEVLLTGTTSPFLSLEGRRVGEFTLRIEGKRLDRLGDYLLVSLPAWGPFHFEARFQGFGGGRVEAEVVAGVGESELNGRLTLERKYEPPRMALSLAAPTIQLADFALGDWSAFGEAPAAGSASSPVAGEPAPPGDRALLSSDVMRRVDATLDVRVDRVASGEDWLGAGTLKASLEGGRLALAPLQVDVPGGGIVIESEIQVSPGGATAAIRLDVRRFDYGVLARRARHDTDMAGLLAMVVDLRASAPSARELLQYASGRFDVAVFPERLEAGIIDLWAVNLAAAALPTVTGEESKVNCLLAMMDMEDGVMSEHALLVDTSRTTVHGRATFDFHTRRVDVTLAPRAKRPEFFSVATPIHIEGRFEDFDLDVRASDLIGTVFRFVTSPVHVPIRRLFSSQPDTKDIATCMAAVQRE
jgi:uncharacterized protein involved in outer membrane biogenesis